jgi:hypothetical protein
MEKTRNGTWNRMSCDEKARWLAWLFNSFTAGIQWSRLVWEVAKTEKKYAKAWKIHQVGLLMIISRSFSAIKLEKKFVSMESHSK